MACIRHITPARLVGDPVDVITGANLEEKNDFQLPGPIPFAWTRHYNSDHHAWQRALGWGHTHEYDAFMRFDLDGMQYVGPTGEPTYFTFLESDGDEDVRQGYRLVRKSETVYQLLPTNGPAMQFVFTSFDKPAYLSELIEGRHRIRFSYDQNGELRGIRLSDRRMLVVKSDAKKRVLSIALQEPGETQPSRYLAVYTYDDFGNLVEGVDAYRHRFSFAYDQNNRMTRKTDRRGYSFFFEYDDEGRCVHSYGEDGLLDVRLTYDPVEHKTVLTRPDGGTWTYYYDQDKTLIQIVDPYEGLLVFRTDEDGRVVEEVDSYGNASEMLYGDDGRLYGRIDPLGYFRAVPEDPDEQDPRHHRVAANALEWEWGDLRVLYPQPPHPDTFTWHRLPDEAKAVLEKLRQGGWPLRREQPQIHFDPMGLKVRADYPDGTARRWAYDANGNIRHYRDREKADTRYEYASWNHRYQITDALGRATRYTYTDQEMVASVTDPGGTKHQYGYDLKDRLNSVDRHGALRESYHYDLADNLIEKRDADGQTLLTFQIGPGNLKTVRRLASGENHYFDYDERGRFIRAATDDFEIRFAYDGAGHRVEESRDGLGIRHRYSGSMLTETTLFGRYQVRYSRPSEDVYAVQDPIGRWHTVQFLPGGLMYRKLAGGSSELSGFDEDGRCRVKQCFQEDQQTRCRIYHYSQEGNLSMVEDERKQTLRYTYDAAHRLSRTDLPDGTVQTFRYDAADNLIEQPGLVEARIASGNRLVWADGDRYDYNNRNHISGSTGRGGNIRYHYDARDMLTGIDLNGRSWTGKYDPLGRRVQKSFNGETTTYYWDTDRLAAEVFHDGRVRIYIYTDSVALTPFMFVDYDNIDAPPESGRAYYVFGNHLGAPVRVEDENGTVVWQARLDPYGRAHVEIGTRFHQPLRFPGHYFDAETGLHYNRFRYYNPTLGRYLQSDPTGIAGGLNLYAYTSNPLIHVDVRGLCEGDDSTENGSSTSASEDGPDSESTGEIWSSTSSKTGVENALGHWNKHKGEFPDLQNATQYVRAAKEFGANPPDGAGVKTRPNGDKVVFDPATDTFGVFKPDGTPRTMFKPDPAKHGHPTNQDYFDAQ